MRPTASKGLTMRASSVRAVAAGTLLLGAASVLGATSASAGLSEDWSVSKTHQGNFTVGQTGTFTISANAVIQQGGNGNTVTITDTLPNGLTFNSFTAGPDGWSCSASGSTVTCTAAPDISTGQSSTFTITVDVGLAAVPQATNNVTIQVPGDGNGQNNSASDTVTVSPAPTQSPSSSPSTTPTPTPTPRPTTPAPSPSPTPAVLPTSAAQLPLTGGGHSTTLLPIGVALLLFGATALSVARHARRGR
jgi:fimbrial isopeptide formation D2 family protein